MVLESPETLEVKSASEWNLKNIPEADLGESFLSLLGLLKEKSQGHLRNITCFPPHCSTR